MKMTIYDTPVIMSLIQWLSRFLLKVSGWKITGKLPDINKYIIIFAPHTSNWDFLFGILVGFSFRKKTYWMGKKELFRRPFGGILKWLGGFPVDRSRSNHVVPAVIEEFNKNEFFSLVVAPEGSRSKVSSWKTGFYYIAAGAGVPILFSYLDYSKKTGGFGPLFFPTINMGADMNFIKEFYKEISGKNKENQSAPVIRKKLNRPEC